MTPTLVKNGDLLEVDLSNCRGSEFEDVKTKVKEVDGRRWEPERKIWTLPAEPQIAERVLHTIQPEADPSIAQWVKESRQAADAELVSPLPDDAELLIPWAEEHMPWQPEDIEGLKPHQRALVAAAAKHDEVRVIVADDMGLGKTAEAIAIISESYKITEASRSEAGPTLIVCPNSVKGVWKREIKRWLGPDEPVQIVDGTSLKTRQNQLREAIATDAWSIVNYEQLRTVREKVKTKAGGVKTVERMKNPIFEKTNWGAAVADECHRAKNRKALQTRGLYRVRAPIMIAASGTPLMNAPDDLWSILHWLWPKEYTSYWRFFEKYVDYVQGYFGRDIVGVRNPDALRVELNKKLYRRTKNEVLKDLPEKTRVTIPVALDSKSRKLYKEVETRLWFELEKAIQEGDQTATRFVSEAAEKTIYTIPNGAARTVRLRQVLSNTALLEGDDYSNKMDALIENVVDNKHKQHVIFSEFVQSCNILVNRLEREGLSAVAYTGDTAQQQRAGVEDAFQRGDIDVFVGTIGAAKEGITLTAADTAHFLERTWVPAWNTQAEDRIHRIGAVNAVTIYIYEAEETVDDGTIFMTNKLKERIMKTVLPQDAVAEEIK